MAILGSDKNRLLGVSRLLTIRCEQVNWLVRGGKVVPSLAFCRTIYESSLVREISNKVFVIEISRLYTGRFEKAV